MKRPNKRLPAALSLSLAALLATTVGTYGCTLVTDSSVSATFDLIDQTDASGARHLSWANGTYGTGCTSRLGGWSLLIAGDASMDYAPLTVLATDSTCSLTLTSLVGEQAFASTPPLALGASYAGAGTSFSAGDGGAAAFYGYGSLSAPTFTNDFVVYVLLSDNPGSAGDGGGDGGFADAGGDGGDGGDGGGPAGVTATSTATAITAPDYMLDLASGGLRLTVDAKNIVRLVAGYAVLVDGANTGSSYYVDRGSLPANPTFAQLDSGYAAVGSIGITGANPQVAAASFGLMGADLSSAAVRTIVVRRIVSGVPSYQALRITFSHS